MKNENEMTEGGLLTKGQARDLADHFGCKQANIYKTGIIIAVNETEDRFVPHPLWPDFIRSLKAIRFMVKERYECRVIGAQDDGQHGWLITTVTDRDGPPMTQEKALRAAIYAVWLQYSGDNPPLPVDEKITTVRSTEGHVMTVKTNKYGVAIGVEGYDHFVNGEIAYLENTDGELILYVWADHDNQDPTHRIEFSPTPEDE